MFKTNIGGNSMELNNQNTVTEDNGSRKNEINIGNFSVRCGNRYLIVRPKFEEFLINNSYV